MQLELRTSTASARPSRQSGHGARPAGALSSLVEAFALSALDNLETRRSYRAHLTKAFTVMKAWDPADLTLPRLAAFRAVATSSGAPATQAVALSALRRFLRWLKEVGIELPFSIEAARAVLAIPTAQTVSVPEILRDDEIARLLDLARVPNGDRAMLLVFLGSGLRESELCSLDCADVLVDVSGGGPALRVRGKRRKERIVPVHPPVLAALEDYLRATARTLSAPGPLFLPHDHGAHHRPSGRLSTRTVRRRVARLMKAAAVTRGVRPHGLRHTFATAIIRAGGKIHVLRRLLGHASIRSTQRYVDHLEFAELRDAIPAALVSPPPRAGG